MLTPKISVIMPIYNAAKFLGDTIRSLRNQTLQEFEVICVNDGSTDNSVDILRQVMAEDNRFRLIDQDNSGAGAARNTGFSEAKGEYVIFLDSDDLFLSRMLEKLYTTAKEADADVVGCDFIQFDADGNEKRLEGVYQKWIPRGKKVFNYQDCPDYIMRVINPVPWNKLYKSEFIRGLGLRFDEISSTNDIAFSAVSVAAAQRVTFIPEALIKYRIGHAGTISSGKSRKLNNVTRAVTSTVRQAAALPHGELIGNDIACFTIGNYLYSLSNYIDDFKSEEAREFYTLVHDTFRQEKFDGVCEEMLHNPKQYLDFCTVRKHDYRRMCQLLEKRLIVSLTTYPRRIHLIPQVLESIYKQTRKADEIVLWLAEEQFPGREEEFPEDVRNLVLENRLTIRWCDDLKPHKKYFYALQEYSDDLVVTLDDDLLYSPYMLSSLYASYLLYPECVSTVRAHLVMLDEQNQIMPYNAWIQETDYCIHKPSMQLMATGGAGVLHPPGLFRKEFFDAEAIRENCLWADDLWLKAMQLVSGVPVVVARQFESLRYLPGSQDEALQTRNVQHGQNDVQLANISAWLDKTFEPGILIKKLTQYDGGERIIGIGAVSRHLDQERKSNRRKYLQADTKLRQVEQQKRNTETKLAQANESLKQASAEIRQLRNEKYKLEKEQEQTERKLRQTERKLQQTEEKLARTNEQLRWTRDHMPIGVQMQDLGAFLRQKRESSNLLLWGCKYAIYLCGWIPLKLLTGTMYFLKNGFKATAKRIISKLFRRG